MHYPQNLSLQNPPCRSHSPSSWKQVPWSMAGAVTDATVSRSQSLNHYPLIGKSVTLAVAGPKSITTTPRPTNRLGFIQLWHHQRALESETTAQTVYLIRVLKGREQGAHLHPRIGRIPCLLKICRLMIDTIDQWNLLYQAAASNIPSRRNLSLLIAAPLSACPPPKTAGMHIEPRQNQSELAPAEVHPLRASAPHPLKIDDKKLSVKPAPARLAWIRTSRPRNRLTRRRMTNGIPSGLRQTVRY